MEYPFRTVSGPVTGQEAKELLESIENGGSMTNDAGRATIARILARRRENEKKQDATDGDEEVRED